MASTWARVARRTAGAAALSGAAVMAWPLLSREDHDGLAVIPVADAKSAANVDYSSAVPDRAKQLETLKHATKDKPLDVLVIGGGATGVGCTLDAALRGLKTGMVEREDFAAGTSSRSTKLIHGGVRYLEKAVFNLDYGQLKLVFEALHERKGMLDNAPHLTRSLPIMTPCYSWWEIPFYWCGLRLYDLIAGTRALTWSSFVSSRESLRRFPTLRAEHSDGRSLKGTIMYYDGQFDDSRLATTVACSAAHAGAAVANHTEVVSLIKTPEGKVRGARCRDMFTGKEFDVHAKVVINACGPFVDGIRKMSNEKRQPMIMPSAGVHITLPDYYAPEGGVMGMIVPKTKDGRVVFMLPWLDHTIAGTTDSSTDLTMEPRATEEEVDFILDALSDFLSIEVRKSDVLSAWSGIRPLAADPTAADTQSISRDHVIAVEDDDMVTVAGGKWTTYRRMAEEGVDRAIEVAGLQAGSSRTDGLKLRGAAKWTPGNHAYVAQHYKVPHRPGSIDTHVALHLSHAYGDRAIMVTRLAEELKLGKRLVRGHPMLEAEVVYCCRHEYCETAKDFIARRTRMAFLDTQACKAALPRIVELMAAEKGWGRGRKQEEIDGAMQFLKSFETPGTAKDV
ncbi:unnamed protein product [Pedinophyceae sp. YPF-701]|nr:unnamed protein product [Pedinophyceae sp. YPF-701]